jgi:hypothetical protein
VICWACTYIFLLYPNLLIACLCNLSAVRLSVRHPHSEGGKNLFENAGWKNEDRGSIGSLCSLREAAMDMLVVRQKEKAMYENRLQKMEAELVEVFLSLRLMKERRQLSSYLSASDDHTHAHARTHALTHKLLALVNTRYPDFFLCMCVFEILEDIFSNLRTREKFSASVVSVIHNFEKLLQKCITQVFSCRFGQDTKSLKGQLDEFFCHNFPQKREKMITEFKGKIAAAKAHKIKILEIQREIAGVVSCATYVCTYIRVCVYI